MSQMKVGIGLLLLSGLAACNADPDKAPASGSVKNEPPRRGASTPASPVTTDEVLTPREGTGKVYPKDYSAKEGPYRLFGIEPGDGTSGRGATIADARDWTTRTYREGDALGRGMRVGKIDETSVTLEGAQGQTILRKGADTQLRIVRHKLDVVAEPLGRNFYALDTDAALAAGKALPTYETHDLYGGPVLKLGAVDGTSLIGAADIREGDLVQSVDGVVASEGSLDAITRGLTDGRSELKVRVIRAGVPMDLTYRTKPR